MVGHGLVSRFSAFEGLIWSFEYLDGLGPNLTCGGLSAGVVAFGHTPAASSLSGAVGSAFEVGCAADRVVDAVFEVGVAFILEGGAGAAAAELSF